MENKSKSKLLLWFFIGIIVGKFLDKLLEYFWPIIFK